MRNLIETPSVTEVERYLDIWRSAPEYEKYRQQEKSVVMLFKELYPKNFEINEVLIKVGVLNDFYGTNIRDTFSVAQNIVNQKIDSKLDSADISIIDDIAKVTIKGKERRYYSFASKYCSHHRPYDYPIYDSFVDKVMKYFRDEDHFSEFENEGLRNYEIFKKVILDFRKHYELEKFSLRELDWYLWIMGKENFAPPPPKGKLLRMNNQ